MTVKKILSLNKQMKIQVGQGKYQKSPDIEIKNGS